MKKIILQIFVVLTMVAFVVFSIIILSQNYTLQKEVSSLKLLLEQQIIDTTETSHYFINTYNAYEAKDWNTVTINANAYEKKILFIKEPLNPTIYLYSSYAYYKLFKEKLESKSVKSTDYQFLDLGIEEINKYLDKIKNKSMAYFIKGLLFIHCDQNDKEHMKKLVEAVNLFNKSLGYVEDKNSRHAKNIIYHAGFAKYKIGEYFKNDGNCNKAKKFFNEAANIFEDSKNEDANKLFESIPRLITQCKEKTTK